MWELKIVEVGGPFNSTGGASTCIADGLEYEPHKFGRNHSDQNSLQQRGKSDGILYLVFPPTSDLNIPTGLEHKLRWRL